MSAPTQPPLIHHYFVDEAGDFTLFDRHGKMIVGREGVSKYLMIGAVRIPDVAQVESALSALRADLMADPYFRGVPSFQPEAGRTALFFHAKNDLPEVRREVFRLLPSFGVKVNVLIRTKTELVKEARALNLRGERLSESRIYESITSRLFKNLLHKADESRIVFAERGKTTKTEALEAAIEKAKRNFAWKMSQAEAPNKPTSISCAMPAKHAGLQVIDYYLWTLQRLYEKGEDRFFAALAKDFRLIMDIDDTRNRQYGEWYSDSNPLTIGRLKKLEPVSG